MLLIYPACFYKEKEGNYSVLFPDFNGQGTCGETFAEAMEMAVDFLAGQIYEMKLAKETVPVPTELDKVNPDDLYDEYESVVVNAVSVDVTEYAKKHFEKSVKKTLTIPVWLNDMAVENNINFSQVLQKALKEQLHV